MGIVESTATDAGAVDVRYVVGKSRVEASSFVRLFDNNLKSSNLSAGRLNPRLTDRFPDYHDPHQRLVRPKRVYPGRCPPGRNRAGPTRPDPR